MATSQGAQAIEALIDAAAAVGLGSEAAPSDSGVDLVLISPAGERVLVQVKQVSLASADTVGRAWARNRARGQDSVLVVLVADRITEQARYQLREAGASWLDLRGHLHLAARHLFVDADVPRLTGAPGRSAPLAGQVGREVAALVLLDPAKPLGIREISRQLSRAPSSVSQAMAGLREASLVDADGRPAVPELFWELADRWHPLSVDVQRYPSPMDTPGSTSINELLRLGLDEAATATGWALTDTMAAAAYGAAVATRSGYPPDFYVPDQTVLRRAVQLLGAATSHDSRAATVRVAPVSLVCADRIDMEDQEWPLARPLFVALDLAQDPDRGHAILDTWTPPEGTGHRVW